MQGLSIYFGGQAHEFVADSQFVPYITAGAFVSITSRQKQRSATTTNESPLILYDIGVTHICYSFGNVFVIIH